MQNFAAGTTLITGLVFGLSLIVAVGPQNAFLLRQGVTRSYVGTVVAICSVSDVVLICAGIAGAGALISADHWMLSAVRVGGAAFLIAYGAFALYRAFRPAPAATETPATQSRWSVVNACLGFTWLNPVAYLDTIVLLGSVANTHPGHQWSFGTGAILGSVLWFVVVGFGSRLFSPLFAKPLAWRVLDGFVAVVMSFTAVRLLLGA